MSVLANVLYFCLGKKDNFDLNAIDSNFCWKYLFNFVNFAWSNT